MKKVFIFLSTFLTVVVLLLIKKNLIYNYDVKKDYSYDFRDKNSTFSNNQTTFLKVSIKSEPLGYIFQPYVEVKDNNKSLKNYFELRGKGVRYINISSFDKQSLKLIPHFLKLENKNKFIIFQNPNLKNKKILIIAPHPDDAEIASFGLYSKYPKNTYIITITAGEAGEPTYSSIYHDKKKLYLTKGEVRTFDSIYTPSLGGIPPNRVLNLGYFDATLKKMYDKKDRDVASVFTKITDINTFRKQNLSPLKDELVSGSSWNSLVKNLSIMIEKIKPDIIITPYPKLDSHIDHKLSSVTLFEAIKRVRKKDGKLLLYSNHFQLNEFFPYGDMGDIVSLPPYFENFYFDSIFSFSLTKKQIQKKVLALDSMSDLRVFGCHSGFCITSVKTIFKSLVGINDSRFNRAIRANELYFVVDINNIYNDIVLKNIIGVF